MLTILCSLIVLLAHSLSAIGKMLKIYEEFAEDCDMKFNSSKSVAMRNW